MDIKNYTQQVQSEYIFKNREKKKDHKLSH